MACVSFKSITLRMEAPQTHGLHSSNYFLSFFQSCVSNMSRSQRTFDDLNFCIVGNNDIDLKLD